MGDKKIPAIMSLEKGEEIAGMWITPPIIGTGFYKLLAKEKKDGSCEWAHFIQREDGTKDSFFTGNTKNREELNIVVEVINANLSKTFGKHIQLQNGAPDVYTLDGKRVGKEIN